MGDISLAEFLVYGFLTYSSMLMLIISTIKGLPQERTRINTVAQVVFLLPGLITAPLLATSGPDITWTTVNTLNTIRSVNTTQVWTENSTQTSSIVLQSPVWLTVHMMIFFVLLIYIIRQFLLLLMAEA